MFIEEKDLVEIIIYYKKAGRTYFAYDQSEFNEITDQKEKEKFKRIAIKMKNLTWSTYNDLYDSASVTDLHTGRSVLSFKKFKELKLITLIDSWDATHPDKKDQTKSIPIPVNEQNILKLAPSIAEKILSVYDDFSIVGEDDEKKS